MTAPRWPTHADQSESASSRIRRVVGRDLPAEHVAVEARPLLSVAAVEADACESELQVISRLSVRHPVILVRWSMTSQPARPTALGRTSRPWVHEWRRPARRARYRRSVQELEALERSRAEFDRRLQLVRADDWARATPCIEWTVSDLVNHVVGGCRRYTMLLHGAHPDETNALRGLDHLGADPVGAFGALADEMSNAFREPSALNRMVHHPAGDRSGRTLLEMRIMDFTIHAWDLARAIGSDDSLDPDLVARLWDGLPALVAELAPWGYFRPASGQPPADGPLQLRLLHLTGRSPET